MEVRAGYKWKEIGVIPEDWQVKLLPEVCRFRGGKAHEQYISDTGAYVCVNSKFISTDGVVRKHSTSNFCPANKGDVLMVMSDLPNGRALAKAYLVEADDRYAVNQRVCALTPYRDSSEYLFYVLNRNPYFLNFDDGVSQTHLLNPVFENCLVPMPPTVEEQRAIAAALGDIDGLLAGLDRLIAKKRDLKQAAMQQLLTGQTRLPGFQGEWEVKRLGDHVTFLRNGVNSRAELQPEGRVKYLHYGDIHASTDSFLSPQTLPSLPDAKAARLDRLRDGDVIFADASEDIAGVCKSVELRGARDTEAVSGLHTIAARFDKTVLADGFKGFLQYCPSFATHLRRLAAGTKVYATNRAHIASVEMRLPSVAEQTAIATALSDIDAELTALETRRDKTRALKQAMMQELLTGRTRLIEFKRESAAAC